MKFPLGEYHRIPLMITQHWFMWWLGVLGQQAIIWAIVDLYLCRRIASPSQNELIITTKLLGGYTGFTPSVCPSVRPSRMPCPLCNICSSGWILSILGTNDHYHERVCRAPWPLTLTYIFKVIRPWLKKSCPLCSIYSSGWILFIFGTNNHYYWRVCRVLQFFRIWKFEFLANFLNFSALTLKKNLQFSMDSFHI